MKLESLPLQSHFTYGFELEGRFKQRLCEDLASDYNDSRTALTDYRQMLDGSVNLNPPVGFPATQNTKEVALGIFENLPITLKYLRKFNGDNYLHNNTCGLHIHIKPDTGNGRKNKELREQIFRWEFIKSVQDWSRGNLNAEARERLESNDFCYAHRGLGHAYHSFHAHSKYRSIANRNIEGGGTIEIRFLPTSDRERNFKKFFEFFFTTLNDLKDKPIEVEREVDIQKESKKVVDKTEDLTPEKKEIEIENPKKKFKATNSSETQLERLATIFDEQHDRRVSPPFERRE